MPRKYLITENEFESIRVEGRDLVATRDNGTPVNFGQVVPDISPEMQQLLDDTEAARDQAEVFSATTVELQDTAIAQAINTQGSETQTQLNDVFGETAAVTSGNNMHIAAGGGSRDVAATGHSLFYGQDTTATGTTPPTNGATQTRSEYPTTSALNAQSAFLSTSAIVLINQTRPGDRTADALTRWATGTSGDIEYFWLDTNDALGLGSGDPLTDAETAENMNLLAKRAQERNAAFIVIGGMPVQSKTNSWKVFASAETERTIAERLGAIYIDAGELANGSATTGTYWTDGTHLAGQVYSLIGARLAALLGPKGVNPPKVAAGRRFDWRDALFAGAPNPVTASTPSAAGRVTRINAGETVGFSFWATEPVIPVATFRQTNTGVAGLFTNLNVDQDPHYATIYGAIGAHQGTQIVKGPMVASPGPAGFVVRAESGTLDLISIEFIPADITLRGEPETFTLGPVGGKTVRANTDWEAHSSWYSGVALKSGQPQTTDVQRRWMCDMRLGETMSGLILAPGFSHPAYRTTNGYFIMRNGGSSLLVRHMVGNQPTDLATVPDVFDADGIISAAIELHYSAGTIDIYVDQDLAYSIADVPYRFLSVGAISGSQSSDGYAFGSITVK